MNLPLILKLFYSTMTVAVLSLAGFYVRGLTSARGAGGAAGRAKMLFRCWIGLLIAVAIGFHLLTAWQVPWVHWEIKRGHIDPHREVSVSIESHRFNLPDNGIRIQQGQIVKFAVTSSDLTYGFGVFREDGTMEFQMQVLPGHSNEIIWVFSQPGRYSIRSTEYAGVETWKMQVKNAIEVSPAPVAQRDDKIKLSISDIQEENKWS